MADKRKEERIGEKNAGSERLMDAIGEIDEALIRETERFREDGRIRRRRQARAFAGVLAAAVLLGILVIVPRRLLRTEDANLSGGSEQAVMTNGAELADSAPMNYDTASVGWDMEEGSTGTSSYEAWGDSAEMFGDAWDGGAFGGEAVPGDGRAEAEAAREEAAAEEQGIWDPAEAEAGAGEQGGREPAETEELEAANEAVKDAGTDPEAEGYPEELLALQARILEAAEDGELPFVFSAELQAAPDRLLVTVDTEDEEALERLREFDPEGEWLEIVPGGSASSE